MMKFRTKPVIIEAMLLSWATWNEICDFVTVPGFVGTYLDADGQPTGESFTERMGAIIPTPEGRLIASEGDWIIRGVAGEFYPCKPEIFAQTYESVEPQQAE